MAAELLEGIEASLKVLKGIGLDLDTTPWEVVEREFVHDVIEVTGADFRPHKLTRRTARLEDGMIVRPAITRFQPRAGVKYKLIEVHLDKERGICFPVDTKMLKYSDELLKPDQAILEGVIFILSINPRNCLVEPKAYHPSGKIILPIRGFKPIAYTREKLKEMAAAKPPIEPVRYRVSLVEKSTIFNGYEMAPKPIQEAQLTGKDLATLEEIGAALPSDAYTLYFEDRRYECFDYLSLPVTATKEQVQQAYREKVMYWNPDTIQRAVDKVKGQLKQVKKEGNIEEFSNAEALEKAMEEALEKELKAQADAWEAKTGKKANEVTLAAIKLDILVLRACYDRCIALIKREKDMAKLKKVLESRCTGQTGAQKPCRNSRSQKEGHDPLFCVVHQPEGK